MESTLTQEGLAPKDKSHVPGEVGIWVFIMGDMMIFGILFCTFLFYRAEDVELYIQSQSTLNQNYGAINTLFLLASSWFVVMGVEAARRFKTQLATAMLGSAFACGIGFGVVKILEYSEKVQAGLTLTTNDFYMFYYMLTGIHFLHVIIGLVVLAFLVNKVRRPLNKPGELMVLESGASYWHMVDVLWIVLFPLIYLLK